MTKKATVDVWKLNVGRPLYALWHPTLGFYRDNWGNPDFGSTMKKSGTCATPEDAAAVLEAVRIKLEADLVKFREKYPDGIKISGKVCRTPTWYTDYKRQLKDIKIVKVSVEVVDL